MISTFSTTVGLPHQRTSRSRMISSLELASVPVFFTDRMYSGSVPRVNSLKLRLMPRGVIFARMLPTTVPILSDSAALRCGQSCSSAPFNHTHVSKSGRLHQSGRSSTIPRSPPRDTRVSAAAWSSSMGVSVRLATSAFFAFFEPSTPLPCVEMGGRGEGDGAKVSVVPPTWRANVLRRRNRRCQEDAALGGGVGVAVQARGVIRTILNPIAKSAKRRSHCTTCCEEYGKGVFWSDSAAS